MSGMTDVVMILLVGVMGYYMLTYMGQIQPASGTTGDTTNISYPIEEQSFYELGACANFIDSDETEDRPCEKECGEGGNGYDCNRCEVACGQPNQYEKKYVKGKPNVPNQDRCSTLFGGNCKGACGPKGTKTRCERCEDVCGTHTVTRSFPGPKTTNLRNVAGLCTSQGGVWNSSKNCCNCKGKKLSQVTCCTGTGYVAPKTTSKTAPKKGLTPKQKNLPNKLNQCAGLTGQTYKNCVNSYAHAYLGSAFSRWGPSYNYRDMFEDRLIQSRTVPSPVDFRYESVNRPYFLGPRSVERSDLIKRFQSNFSRMQFSNI